MPSTDIMNKAQDILEICKRKLENGKTIKEVKKFVVGLHGEAIWQEIYKNISDYNNVQKRIRKKNQRFWMLISSPSAWHDERGDYIVNKRLRKLNNSKIQSWRIDGSKDITEQMREGEMGIIKVSDDKRSKEERIDDKGGVVDKLHAGIYGIFKIVRNEDGDVVYETDDGYWRVNIKVIDNFYNKGKIIPKEEAIGLLGKNVYKRMGSGEIDKSIYERVLEYQPLEGER